MKGFVYIPTTARNTVLYTGVTSDLKDRLQDHINNRYPGSFTSRYNVKKLEYFERCQNIPAAIEREKQIKAGSRKKKIELINSINPEWKDLSSSLDG